MEDRDLMLYSFGLILGLPFGFILYAVYLFLSEHLPEIIYEIEIKKTAEERNIANEISTVMGGYFRQEN